MVNAPRIVAGNQATVREDKDLKLNINFENSGGSRSEPSPVCHRIKQRTVESTSKITLVGRSGLRIMNKSNSSRSFLNLGRANGAIRRRKRLKVVGFGIDGIVRILDMKMLDAQYNFL